MERCIAIEVSIIMKNGKDDIEKIVKQIVRRLRGLSEFGRVEAERL